MSKIFLKHFFFFNDTATTEIYTLSLHDALPISGRRFLPIHRFAPTGRNRRTGRRSEEHTSELQSRVDIVCRLLLEKKNENTPSTAVVTVRGAQRGGAGHHGNL